MQDYDNEIGFWTYGVPYVWINNKDMKECRRLYLVYNQDDVFVSHRTYKEYNNLQRSVQYSRVMRERNHSIDDISLLDLWRKDGESKCSWAARYFGVYDHTLFKGKKLSDMDVRINGKPMSVPEKPNVLGYLRAAFRVPQAPRFIQYPPDWSD